MSAASSVCPPQLQAEQHIDTLVEELSRERSRAALLGQALAQVLKHQASGTLAECPWHLITRCAEVANV